MQQFDFFNFCQPGIYMIICTKNQKIYIGQSSNCLYRIGGHFTSLKNNTHSCVALLKDFKKYDPQYFQAFIIKSGAHYDRLQIRQKEELQLINQQKKHLCYNFLEKKEPNYKSFSYKNQIFFTIKELRLFINLNENKNYSETDFRRKFINPDGCFHNQIILIKTRPQTDQFLVNDQICYGWKDVVEKQFAETKRQVFYRLNSSTFPNFKYLKQTKKRVGFNQFSKKFIIDGVWYKTASLVVDAGLAKDINQVYYRVRSPKWKTWTSKKP